MRLDSMRGWSRALTAAAAGLALMAGGAAASAQTVAAGDIAIIGWIDNGNPNDIYSFVTLAPIPAGTVIYFTDNGWTGTIFRGASATDGDGNENLAKWTAVNAIAAGRIIATTDTSADFTWTFTGAIPGTTSGSFAVNSLSQSGDQLYAFQGPTNNPLFTPSNQVFVLDDTGAFEAATNSNQGDVPPGLSAAANTAITFNQSGTGQDFMAFNTNTLASGTKEDWLAAINNAANWTFGASGTLPTGTIVIGGICVPPSITMDPASTSACPGDMVVFSVTATGDGLTYQWRKDGNDIGGETGTTYTIASATVGDEATYDVVVTGTCGVATSDGATLTLGAGPSISDQPDAAVVCEGDPVTFTVVAANAVSYQWRKDGNDIGGETSDSYTIAAASSGDAGTYDVVIQGACGTSMSDPADLTVSTGPIITASPSAQNAKTGDFVKLSVTATTLGNPSYQWRRDTVALTDGGNVSGANTAMLTLNPIALADGGTYDVVITDACGTNTSDGALLGVQDPILLNPGCIAIIGWVDNDPVTDRFTFVTLTDIPADVDVYFTDNGWTGTAFRGDPGDGDGNENLVKWTSINPIAAGTIINTTDTSADFVWTSSGQVPGGTSGSFQFPSLSQSGEQIYAFQGTGSLPLEHVLVHLFVLDDTGAFEAATSSTTGAIPPGLSQASFTAVTFTQNGTGQNFMGFNTNSRECGLKAQWLAAIGNAADWTFGGSGTLPSGSINVSCDAPAIDTDPASQSVNAGDMVTFTVVASGCGPFTYQWRKDGNDILGENSASYTIASAASGDAGDYDVVVTNDCGDSTSAVATLTVNAVGCPNNHPGCDHSDIFPVGGDCVVDLSDLGVVLANFAPGIPGKMRNQGDIFPLSGGDGFVDLSDLGQVLADFGTDCR